MTCRACPASAAIPLPALISLGEVAAILDVAKRTVLRLILSRDFPASIRIGGSIRWRRSEIEGWSYKVGCASRITQRVREIWARNSTRTSQTARRVRTRPLSRTPIRKIGVTERS